jgi:glucokinase
VTSDEPAVAAIDWGGTWIRAALVAGDRILHRERMAKPPALPEQYTAIDDLTRRCSAAVGRPPVAAGVGIAGLVQRGLVMSALNLGITRPTDVTGELREQLGVPVHLVNDMQAAAVGVAGRWPDGLTAVMSMGTGVGGAVLDGGRLLTGEGAAGDFGHVPVQPGGLDCPCGGTGCLETLVSGQVLAATAQELAESGRSGFLATRLSARRRLHAGDLQDACEAGDEEARGALDRAAAFFAIGVRTVVATVNPARILLAGALLSEDSAFGRLVRHRWHGVRPYWCETPLIHVHDDVDAALRGAAALAASYSTKESE